MLTNATITGKKRGRPALSPNGVDRELAKESQEKHRKKRKSKNSRLRIWHHGPGNERHLEYCGIFGLDQRPVEDSQIILAKSGTQTSPYVGA